MKNTKTTNLVIRIYKEKKEALRNKADKRGLILSDFMKEIIDKELAEKIDDSSPGKNSITEKQESENKEEKEFDNLLEAVILYKAGELDI